ncbi:MULTISPECIES: LacI family DNA-binding transcriptional regulator [unclassified Fusibacter]|uniref:LacI family DNA-binding transcriptional regulator n=1 Tax=unclassified Fusibacter TaxID=2624464 RepID=UPI0010122B5A|nr:MULTISPECIES: LacI family DNA-binding transcriptional regulator [unclassified Fusibacter]MCK8059403.1 LacI family transcriptional regulator [Fusibacter sp. A2]NPE21133.1 LacI family transcriptional regulator [Fusibacter sp. A1]RXV62402.1 LacI family transcriptional regulator [Fusibacter sp. A1]
MNIKDIAKVAGVAVSTVSRVLNDHPDVSSETREHVLRIIDQYNYIPNNSARNLKRVSTNTIGVMVKGRDNPFFSKMIQAIEDLIAREGYSMVLHYHHVPLDDTDAAIEFIKEKRLRGLICLGGDFTEARMNALEGLDVPIVLTSVDMGGVTSHNVSTVTIKNEHAAQYAVAYLIRLGHRRIGLVTTSENDTSVGRLRMQGYKNALVDAGIKIDQSLIVDSDYTFKCGYDACKHMLDLDERPTAIFAISDVMAIGVGKAILDAGLRIPEDISVMGFDGLDYSQYFHPSIATVSQPVLEMGRISAEVLLEHIKSKIGGRQVILDTELLIRASVSEVISK